MSLAKELYEGAMIVYHGLKDKDYGDNNAMLCAIAFMIAGEKESHPKERVSCKQLEFDLSWDK